jgi:hypothetical protein
MQRNQNKQPEFEQCTATTIFTPTPVSLQILPAYVFAKLPGLDQGPGNFQRQKQGQTRISADRDSKPNKRSQSPGPASLCLCKIARFGSGTWQFPTSKTEPN